MKTWHKTSAIVLAVVMLLLAIPFTAMAEGAPVNIAEGKTATTSSALDENHGADKVTDGIWTKADGENFWSTAQHEDMGAWVAIDLGKVYTLDSMKIDYRRVPWEEGINSTTFYAPGSVTLQYSLDGETWETAVSKSTEVPVNWAYQPIEDEFNFVYDMGGVQGRYVRVLMEDGDGKEVDGYVQLAEVAVYGEEVVQGPVNIAEGKTATTSSALDENHGADKVTDGIWTKADGENFWSTAQHEDMGAWVAIDLGAVYTLNSMKIDYRRVPWEEGINSTTFYAPGSVTLQYSLDGENWETAVSKSTEVPVNWAYQPIEDEFNFVYDMGGVQGRYVRVLMEDGDGKEVDGYVQLAEVAVYGEETEQPVEPTDPEPTDPEPTDPEPTDPEPTEPPQLTDLAAGKNVTASSTMEGSSTANITDGDRNSFWASDKFENTGTNKSTLEIDLGSVCDLESVKLFYPLFENGINGHSNPWKITIYGKNPSTGEWVKIGGVDDEQGLIEGLEEATWWVSAREIQLAEGTAARYVKIELEGMKDDTETKDAHRICKLTIMGYEGIPGTGDYMNTAIVILPILALCGMAAVVVFRKKFSV